MRSSSVLVAVSLLSFAFAGCDFVDTRAIDREREDSIYKDAMADYTAGRMDKAVAGLQRVLRANPGNSSARFQLACLLQDVKKDYLGAICHYREFLVLDRSGDKSSFAKDRIIQCERALGPELLAKYNAGDAAVLAGENETLREKVAELEKAKSDLEKRLEKANVRAEESSRETERMRRMLTGEVSEDVSKPAKIDEKALLDDEDDGKLDRIKISQDAKNLIIEGEQEQVTTPFEVVEKKTPPPPVEKKSDDDPPHEERPSEYVVQDGDTLYKIASRFYGRRSAWIRIRDANKAVISTDGRVRAGQKIILP